MTPVSLGYGLLGLVLFFFAAVWWGCARYSKSENGFCLYAFCFSCCWAAGVILLSFRGGVSDWLTYNLCMFLVIAGFICLVWAVESFYDLPSSRLSMVFLLVISGSLLIVVGPSLEHQIYRLAILGVVSAYCCSLALKKGIGPLYREHGPMVAYFIGGVGVVATLLWLYRLKSGQQMTSDELSLVANSSFNLSALYMIWLVAICFQGAMLFLLIARFAGELEYLSTIDHLTGTHNRLGLKKCCARVFPHQLSGTLLMLDIDHFKKVNDTYGHDLGDAVLKLVVQRINSCIRNDDVLSRYGGEEFVVLLPGSDLARGYRLAERIRASIEKDPLELSGQQLKVTVSIGVVSMGAESTESSEGSDSADVDEFITKADKALYQAKEQGRNQVVVAQC